MTWRVAWSSSSSCLECGTKTTEAHRLHSTTHPLPLPRALQLIAVKRMAVPIVSPTLLSVRDDHALARQNAQPTSTNASHQPQAAASASAASEQARRVERLHAEIELMREVGRNGSVAPKDLSGLFWSRHNEKSRGSRR